MKSNKSKYSGKPGMIDQCYKHQFDYGQTRLEQCLLHKFSPQSYIQFTYQSTHLATGN